MFGEIARIENGGEFGPTILAVGTEVLIKFVERGKFGRRRRSLVSIGRKVDDAHGGGGGTFFKKRQEIRCQDYVSHMVQGHLLVLY